MSELKKSSSRVRSVTFAPLDREAFCAQLTFYRAVALPLAAPDLPTAAEECTPPPAPAESRSGRSYPLTFRIPMTELRLEDGHASGSYTDWFGTVPYRIANPWLRKEFHPIRTYFARHLRRSTVEVKADLWFNEADEPVIRRARSPQIDRIDDKTIAVLRARTLRDLIRTEPVDQRLFTREDLMANYAADDPVRALRPVTDGGEELLKEILGTLDVRNAPQLAYLAEHHERGQPLRFALTPRFGFLFFVRGNELHHYLLELLDSHATYVWSLPRDSGTLADHLQRVTQEVQHLNALGRSNYRRSNTFPYLFWTVRHEHIGSSFVDGFPRWKARVEEGLL
ncbi:hypothetical protein GGR26_001167 [Lewinella marina]|uniref:Uncharacterized protein n=1 Tax=Neolewinella marina TaxID=438751 RepID=A0A2G0CFY6_9BACT|nr:hypothetical protein [Neolewinella marina]NJB85422.1 hypothetical protein [Neolewinella marina]PHK98886.1 hypothetical protein CGL56_10520 [Neolewinella marina]